MASALYASKSFKGGCGEKKKWILSPYLFNVLYQNLILRENNSMQLFNTEIRISLLPYHSCLSDFNSGITAWYLLGGVYMCVFCGVGFLLGGYFCVLVFCCCWNVIEARSKQRQFHIEWCFSLIICSAYFYALPFLSSKTDLQTAIKTLLKIGPGLEDAKQSQFIAFRR